MNDGTLASQFDTLLLDLDGVLYIGSDPVPHAADAIAAAVKNAGLATMFVTNNASRTPDEVAQLLNDVGVAATSEEVVSSAQAAAHYLAQELAADSYVFVVGGRGLEVALGVEGLKSTRNIDDKPAAVVQGFHPDIGWRDLAKASAVINSGVPWVASNMDMTLPTEYGMAPGNGSLVTAVSIATGVKPVVVGKPYKPTVEEAVRRSGAKRPLVIGDRLDTDIEAAHNTGLPGLLVLTGITLVSELCQATPEHRPTFIATDLRELNEMYEAPILTADGTELSGWKFNVSDGSVGLVGRGESPILGIRALAAACWQSGAQSFVPEIESLIDELQSRLPDAMRRAA